MIVKIASAKKFFIKIVKIVLIFFLISNAISLYRAAHATQSDEVCKYGDDLVYFFATWCPICRVESKNINLLAEDFSVLAIGVKSPKLQEHIEKNHYMFKFIDDKDGALARLSGVEVYPTIITCRDKRILFIDTGYTSIPSLWFRLLVAKL